jgi:hypothetical protein
MAVLDAEAKVFVPRVLQEVFNTPPSVHAAVPFDRKLHLSSEPTDVILPTDPSAVVFGALNLSSWLHGRSLDLGMVKGFAHAHCVLAAEIAVKPSQQDVLGGESTAATPKNHVDALHGYTPYTPCAPCTPYLVPHTQY